MPECDEIRSAGADEARLLRPLWREAFGDTEEFMTCYEERMFHPNRVELAVRDGETVSMLTVLPAVLRTEEGGSFPSGCVYGVATRTQYRGRGIASRLLGAAVRKRLGHGMDCMAVVPDTPELFLYYGRTMEAHTAFYVREVQVTARQLSEVPVLRPTAAEAEDYWKTRSQNLQGHTYLEWDRNAVDFQKELCRQEGGDLFCFPDVPGCCAAAEYGHNGILLIHELLAPEEQLAGCIAGLMRQMGCSAAEVRLPAWSGAVLGGRAEPFAMLAGRMLPEAQQAYLGFDFA